MKPTTLQLSRNWQLKSQYHWDKDTIQFLFKERKHGSYEYLHWQFSQFLESWPLQLNHQWALACNRRSIPHYRILHMHVPTQRRPCICHPTFLTNWEWSHSSCSHLTLQHSYTQSPDSMNSERKSGEKQMASGQRGDQVIQWTSNCKEPVHQVCSNERPRKVLLLSLHCTKTKHNRLSDCSRSLLFAQFEDSLIPTSSQ
jgi:hypothetical protein